MARDIKDKSTIPLIPEPKKRGRPVTGLALSSAERKRRQRNRDLNLIVRASSGLADIKSIGITSLIEYLSRAVSAGHFASAKDVTTELLRRTKANAKANLPHTP